MRRTSSEETTKRVRLSPQERRTQLIELGLEMLGERSIDDISVGEIAEQAGISRGLLFHYFPSKQDFQLEVARHANADLLERITPDPELGLPGMLRDSISRYVDYISENRTSYYALLRSPTGLSPELAALVDASRNSIVRIILDAAPLPPEERDHPRLLLLIRGWIAFTEETALSWLRTEMISRAELVDLLVESLLALATTVNPALAAAFRD